MVTIIQHSIPNDASYQEAVRRKTHNACFFFSRFRSLLYTHCFLRTEIRSICHGVVQLSVYSNSFAGRANYYTVHMLCKKKKVLRVAGKRIVSKQLTLYDQETTDQYVVDCKVLTV